MPHDRHPLEVNWRWYRQEIEHRWNHVAVLHAYGLGAMIDIGPAREELMRANAVHRRATLVLQRPVTLPKRHKTSPVVPRQAVHTPTPLARSDWMSDDSGTRRDAGSNPVVSGRASLNA